MSRLANHVYLSQQQQLRTVWLDETVRSFHLLTPAQQWALHMYYVPFMRLSQEALLEHRATISANDPTLPQRAGRAYNRLQLLTERLPAYRAARATRVKPKKGSPYNIRIFSEVNPTLDAQKFAQILVNYKPRE